MALKFKETLRKMFLAYFSKSTECIEFAVDIDLAKDLTIKNINYNNLDDIPTPISLQVNFRIRKRTFFCC